MENQSASGSGVEKLQSVKSGNGVSNPTMWRGCPLPSGPWHAAHAARYKAWLSFAASDDGCSCGETATSAVSSTRIKSREKVAHAQPPPYPEIDLTSSEIDLGTSLTVRYCTTVIRLSTVVTPGTSHAARCASSFSAHDCTLPERNTVPPAVST
jgi:hypothetical protein